MVSQNVKLHKMTETFSSINQMKLTINTG